MNGHLLIQARVSSDH